MSWAGEVLVIDSGSTDETQELARSNGARVIERAWTGWSAQRTFGATEAKFSWVFFLDADESPSQELNEAISAINFENTPITTAFAVDRRGDYLGVLLPNSQRASKIRSFIRLFHRDKYQYDPAAYVHESVIVPKAHTQLLPGVLYHWRGATPSNYVQMVDRYSTAEATARIKAGHKFSPARAFILPFARLIYLLLIKREVLLGWRGVAHAFQRGYADCVRESKIWETESGVDLKAINAKATRK